jgi:hypothetical protein
MMIQIWLNCLSTRMYIYDKLVLKNYQYSYLSINPIGRTNPHSFNKWHYNFKKKWDKKPPNWASSSNWRTVYVFQITLNFPIPLTVKFLCANKFQKKYAFIFLLHVETRFLFPIILYYSLSYDKLGWYFVWNVLPVLLNSTCNSHFY